MIKIPLFGTRVAAALDGEGDPVLDTDPDFTPLLPAATEVCDDSTAALWANTG